MGMDRRYIFPFKNGTGSPGLGMILTAREVTRPSRLELKLPMMSNWFRFTMLFSTTYSL